MEESNTSGSDSDVSNESDNLIPEDVRDDYPIYDVSDFLYSIETFTQDELYINTNNWNEIYAQGRTNDSILPICYTPCSSFTTTIRENRWKEAREVSENGEEHTKYVLQLNSEDVFTVTTIYVSSKEVDSFVVVDHLIRPPVARKLCLN
jgi:hypothetical protein